MSRAYALADFVDALSAPIQFLSAAEKRAKQLQGLGIDETDISDVAVTVRQKNHHELPPSSSNTSAAAVVVNGAAQSSAVSANDNQPAQQATAAAVQLAAAGDKDKKRACFARRFNQL